MYEISIYSIFKIISDRWPKFSVAGKLLYKSDHLLMYADYSTLFSKIVGLIRSLYAYDDGHVTFFILGDKYNMKVSGSDFYKDLNLLPVKISNIEVTFVVDDVANRGKSVFAFPDDGLLDKISTYAIEKLQTKEIEDMQKNGKKQ